MTYVLSDLPDRIVEKIHVNPDTGCWEWTRYRMPNGYVQAWWEGKKRYLHRITYSVLVGPIPEGFTIDHLCRVRHCANPAHMEAVTQGQNMLRGSAPAAKNAAKTHCSMAGHPFDEENTRWTVDENGRKHRTCITCSRAYARNRQRELRRHRRAKAAA